MKTKIYSLAALAVASWSLVSCSDAWTPVDKSDAKGRAQFKGIEVVNGESIISRATADVSGFTVAVVSPSGETLGEWKYSEMPEIITLPVGSNYQARVVSHIQEKAAWEAPYFTGSSDKFTISDGEITTIGTVVCRLSNIRVSIRFTEDMKKAMGADCKVVVVANDEGRLEYTASESRSGYFEALEGSSTLVATFSGTVNGNFETIVRPYTDVEAGQHRIITYGIKTGNPTIPDETGFIDPESGISVDMSTFEEDVDGNVAPGDEEVIDGERPGKEDPETPDNPDDPQPIVPDDPTDDKFEVTSATINLDAENTPAADTPYEVEIKSKEPLSNLIVEIKSESLSDDFLRSVGLCAKFDLAYPGEYGDALSGSFGFPIGNEVIGQTAVKFIITDFVPLLLMYPDELHQFILTMKDNAGNQKTVALKFRT